jgi:uncharacterized protein (TIGR04255 family)
MVYAPIVQLLFTLQFEESLPPLNALHIASYCQSLNTRFKRFEQGEPAGPMPYRFEHLGGSEEAPVVVATMPRIQLTSADGTRALFFQNDRFSYGWLRAEPLNADPSYPGYETVRDELGMEFAHFCDHVEGMIKVRPTIGVTELAYTDALPDHDLDGGERRLSSIFTFLCQEQPRRTLRGFDYSWNEQLDPDGILAVRAYGPIVTEGSVTAALLSTTATFENRASNFADSLPGLNAAHERITSTFKTVIREQRREDY